VTFVDEATLVVPGPSVSSAVRCHLEALESGAWVFDKDKTPPRGRVCLCDEREDEFPNTALQFSQWVRTR
jgi:hypothetical protein